MSAGTYELPPGARLPEPVKVPYSADDIRVRPGRATGIPGLVITYAADDAGSPWHVTHLRSGCIVAACREPELAIALAVHVGGFADWTVTASELDGTEGLSDRVLSAAQTFGAECAANYEPNRADLNEVAS